MRCEVEGGVVDGGGSRLHTLAKLAVSECSNFDAAVEL